MRRWWIPATLLALPAAGLLTVSEYCLRMVTKAKRLTVEELRASEIQNGFADCVEAYEKRWPREPVSFTREGVTIRGELIENPADRGPRRRIAVICHGHTANRYGALKYGDIFYRAGWSVLIYDERYFGESGGEYCTLGQEEAKDLALILAWVRGRFGAEARIALHGESMGAATVLQVLSYTSPDMIVADCPFADSEELFRQWFRQNLHLPPGLVLSLVEWEAERRCGYRVKEVSPIAALRRAQVPVCLMHGQADTLIPCSHSGELYAACRDPRSELHLFPGADHAQSIVSDRAGYEEILLAFLDKCGAK